jgi:hypothetical protein
MTFYCMPVNPDPPFIVLVFTGIASLTPDTDIRDALLAKLTSDQTVLDMITTNHSNVPGDHTPAFILNTLFSIAQISTCTVRRRIPRGPTIPIPATRIIFPPFDRDPDVNENFHRHVLSTNFSFAVPLRGTGTPWLGPNPLAPKLIECTECHGSDHYKEDCPILNSDAYRNARGIAPVSANPVAAASSLSFTPAAPTPAHNSIGGAFRGGGRGFIRGGFGGYSRGRGRGGFGRANGHGYSPYYA